MRSGHGWLAGDWPSMGGVFNITAAVPTAGFHWWHSGKKNRIQNVSKYMLVLALCLVIIVIIIIMTVLHTTYLLLDLGNQEEALPMWITRPKTRESNDSVRLD